MAGKNFALRNLRRWVQGISLAGWTIGFILVAQTFTPTAISHWLVLINPLPSWSQAIASRVVSRWMLPGLIVLFSALLVGRAWCGWFCPLGTSIDLFSRWIKPIRNSRVSENLRKGKFLVLTGILLAAIFGNLTLLFLDPITIWVRVMTGGVWPTLNQAITVVEGALVDVNWLEPLVIWLDQLIRPVVLPSLTPGATTITIQLTILAAILLLNLVVERFWCRYLCPLGGLLGWLSRFSVIQRVVDPACKSCGACARVCPTDTIDPKQHFQSDPAECTLCMNCLGACPTSQNQFSRVHPKRAAQVYDPSRRDFLAASLVTLTGLAAVSAESLARSRTVTPLRPPGVEADTFSAHCLRCGICVRTCPTGAIQPGVAHVNWSDLFTPVMSLRDGYCLFSCNACGQACPVEAIPPLSLPEKQSTAIGKAFIDHDRCIPWSEGGSCIICEEMCPLPEKAITLDVREIVLADGSSDTLRLPVVNHELCIGCGICEYKCPRTGVAAIRVFPIDPV